MEQANEQEKILSSPEPGPEPIDQGRQSAVLRDTGSGRYDFARILDSITEKKPINLVGFMGAGKTTLIELLVEHYGYTAHEEELWDALYAYIDKPQSIPKGEFYDEVNNRLPQLISDLILWILEKDASVFNGKIINSWIPWLPEPFVNVVMLIEADAAIKGEEGRGPDYDVQDHYSTMRDKVGTHLSEANTFVLSDDDERSYLFSLLLGEEE